MTFRRVMLVLLPLLAAILVFMGLRLLYLNWEASLSVGTPIPGGGTPDMPVGVVEMTTVDRIGHEVSTNVNLIRKDKTGRTEMWFIADRIEHKTKDTADVDRPQMQFFTRAGEIITLVGDQATVVTKGSLINLEDVRSGRLWGNVVLIHDRATPDDTADDFLVALEDLTFDNETFHMATDGPVVMAGPEVTLTARKMLLAMDAKTRRLNTMEFGEDIFITLETGNRVRLGLMGPAPEGQPAAAPAAPAAPAPATPAAPVTGGTAPAAAPASATAAGDVWRIDMEGRVDARQLDQRLQCEKLVLYNRTGRSATFAAGSEGTADSATAAEAPAAPAAKKAAAGGAPADEFPPPLSVVADGPLLITPVDPLREDPGDQQNQIIATGDPVIVDDAETHITGAEVRYNTKTGSGSVIGKENPILMEQPGRLRLTGGRLDFNRDQATAGVQGEGELHARFKTASLTGTGAAPATPPATGLDAAAPAGAADPAAPDADPAAPDADATDTLDASWTRSMRLEFFRLPTDASSGMGEIKQAAFHGQAVVKQREGVLKGDDLIIDFFAAEPGVGQAVQRLVGHGDVFLKNAEGLGGAAAPAAAP
ncbi:MAG: LPS export ABC transporter periplasmic protein LptC, partial [Planctomycetes bacterium]|nr:LPS export ABC transporter periplasmic protein LptC [Planctomycetota bacterium]